MRNLSATLCFLSLICFFIQVSDTQRTKYCDSDNPYYCVFCGCFETGLTEHNILNCGENEVIRMKLDNIQITSIDNDTCITNINDYCVQGFNNNVETTYAYLKEVYRNCTLQNTCNVTVTPVEQGNVQQGNVKLVRYPFFCENNIQDISIPFSRRLPNPVFYFNGLDYINQNINCDCSVLVYNKYVNLVVEIFYLYGDNICNKFDILPNTRVKNCNDDNVQLYTAAVNIQSKFLKIEIRNMTVTGDEVVFFKVHGDDLDVICTGCITSSGATSPETMSPTPPPTTSTNLTSVHTSSTTTEATTTDLNTSQTSLTSSEGTITNLNSSHGHSTSNQTMNEADSISKAEHEEKLKETNAMFGGIIAAIIIVVILGIGIYCLVRKRGKLQKVKKEEPQPVSPSGNFGEYSHYNYVDLDIPKDTDATDKQSETAKPKHSGEQSQKSNTQQIRSAQNPNGNEIGINSSVSPNLYFVIEPDAPDESKSTKKN